MFSINYLFRLFLDQFGIGTIFYLHIAMNSLEEYKTEENLKEIDYLLETIYPVIYFTVLTSIVSHRSIFSLVIFGRQNKELNE